MELPTLAALTAFVQVVFVDLVLAGDNAIVVGMAVAALPRAQRARAMLVGIAAATVLRIAFASVIVQLLQVIGLVLAGGLLLIWVCWKLWRELRQQRAEAAAAQSLPGLGGDESPSAKVAVPRREKTLGDAVMQIVVADISMSLDNVLAVAGVAREHTWVLVSGLALSVAFMGLAAAVIARLLTRHHWIGYLGLAVIFYVALSMIWQGAFEIVEAATR
jgi:YjbE family integral membrane protein